MYESLIKFSLSCLGVNVLFESAKFSTSTFSLVNKWMITAHFKNSSNPLSAFSFPPLCFQKKFCQLAFYRKRLQTQILEKILILPFAKSPYYVLLLISYNINCAINIQNYIVIAILNTHFCYNYIYFGLVAILICINLYLKKN